MGKSYWFECSRCDYRARVSGGSDRGLDFFVQTILCQDCRQLYDAVTRIRWSDPGGAENRLLNHWRSLNRTSKLPRQAPTFQGALTRLRVNSVSKSRWLQFSLRCPESSSHRFQPWNHPDKCPRCGLILDKNVLPYRIWD